MFDLLKGKLTPGFGKILTVFLFPAYYLVQLIKQKLMDEIRQKLRNTNRFIIVFSLILLVLILILFKII
jgi:hypothetical protein